MPSDADRIAAQLASLPRRALTWRGTRAAVLVALCGQETSHEEPRVLLTKRAAGMRHHGGQYAFPGGRCDPTDRDAIHTALREADEEVGLDPSRARVLGMLDDHTTSTGFLVTPVVAWVEGPVVWRRSEVEVAEVLELPLRAFLTPQPARTLAGEGFRRIVMAYEVDGHFIWGATSSMLRDLARRLAPLFP